MNYVFIVFPVVIYAAVRFGAAEVSAVLGMVLSAIYFSLATHARGLSPEEMAETIWFVQAFCWVLAATGLLVAAFEAEWRRAELATAVERAQTLELSLREERARLDALRYQLSPHFLFNALNSIYSTLPVAGAETSRAMLSELSGYLRSTLAGREDDQISLDEELCSMEQYLAIQKLRFGDDLQIAVTASEDARTCRVPVFLLQPLVENAIVHGFEGTRGTFYLKIHAEKSAEKLEIEVANTGVWKGTRSGGMGLENTRRRLALMFAENAALDVKTSAGWVRVKIKIPNDQ
jgi:LytS/YehU family sensor histidine kinase